MSEIPKTTIPDTTFALASEGYRFISNRCERYNTDIFKTRIGLKNTVCLQGEAAAEMFYNNRHLKREGVAPDFVRYTLFGAGGVQGMDGQAHRHRKEVFMRLMNKENINRLKELSLRQWNNYAEKWEKRDRVMLFPEVEELLCRSVCEWAGVPLAETDIRQRTREFAAMIDASGSVGARNWLGRRARKRANRWIGNLIEEVRENRREAQSDSAVIQVIANHKDLNGQLLDKKVAAVELINILRPTVAVARYIIFAAVALHKHPDIRHKLKENDEEYLTCFVHEVRRFYPFFPFVAALANNEFEWQSYRFPKDTRVMLDLYGTNHDRRIWEDPELFRPERFRNFDINAFNLIPHGGGDHHTNHRCPGEDPAKELIKTALQFLLHGMQYEVPGQNLQISLSRVPAIPKSRFIINNVMSCANYTDFSS